MKTICIETSPSSAIGGGVRYSDNTDLYTTFQSSIHDVVRDHNINRFHKKELKISTKDLSHLLQEDVDIQVVSNDGSSDIPGFYKYPESHPILSKTGIIKIFSDNNILSYLPKSFIISKGKLTLSHIAEKIREKFLPGDSIVLKHSGIDGNGSGVGIIDYKQSEYSLRKNVSTVINKFSRHFGGDKNDLFGADYLIQEYISNTLGEGSITFSIQNNHIENLGFANNVVSGGEYFGSTNVFPYLDEDQPSKLLIKIQTDFAPLLSQLQQEGVRGNVGFDIIFKNSLGVIQVYVLECNGIHRMTGSIIPNNFAHNTKNDLFVGLPIARKYLANKYQDLSSSSLLNLAERLQGFGTEQGKDQIMNIKCDGVEWGYPCIMDCYFLIRTATAISTFLGRKHSQGIRCGIYDFYISENDKITI